MPINLPPGPPRGFPGSQLLRFRRNPLLFLSEGAQQYGDIVRFQLGPRDVILFNHPDYIKEVLVKSGEKVTAGQVLMRLNTDALKVEETAAVAELERYTREEEKSRAASAVAEMQIAGTLARQAAAKLEIVRFRLAQSEIKSSMDGVILEGDHKERVDSPVKQGDALYRIAQLSDYSVDIQLDERDAQEVTNGAEGECAFLSRPEDSLPLKVDLVLPSAVEKDGISVFAARARIQTPEADWWRPGLSGVAKINAGKRSLLWIITHRTVDFLRLKLWW